MENESTVTKTHWMQNPNKNYLGHWDLVDGQDLALTIKSAQIEPVENPKTGVKAEKKVIRFEEDYKPFICNETNAKSIIKATGKRYMEDSVGERIVLYVSQTQVMKERVDCIRVREERVVDIDNTKALSLLNDCSTLAELQKAYLSLNKYEKADKEVVALKNSLKTKLS